jgi:hypothetical protein
MNKTKPTLSRTVLKAISMGAGAKRALKRLNEHVAAHDRPLPEMRVTRQVSRLAERRLAKDRLHARKLAAAKARIKGGMAAVAWNLQRWLNRQARKRKSDV